MLKFFDADPGWKFWIQDQESRIRDEKRRIRDKHPGSATLLAALIFRKVALSCSVLQVAKTFFAICGVRAAVQQVVQDEERAARPPCPPS